MEPHEYFQASEGYFWQWEEEGEVIAIPNSRTIAYKAFLIDILEKLCDQGIPPFGSLLLAIIATNENGEDTLNDVYSLMDKKLSGSNSTREPLTSAINFLKLLSGLPKKYRQGRNRTLVLQRLFANCHNIIGAVKSRQILELYKSTEKRSERFLAVKLFHFNTYNNDFRIISLLEKRFPDTNAIISALADLPLIEELELDNADVIETPGKDFVQELIESSKTFHVGSLIKRLWSGLNIPFHNLLPGNQPIGGVSDLTNKGELSQLLISEFANDDLLFLSRLANNEALYFNRESPPHSNDLERVILIDVSIKSWGTPKAIAYALMLAIAKHPKTDIHCSAFAVGKSFYPVAFNSVDDVVQSLQILDPCLHPAKGLEAFFKASDKKKKMEVFFISSKETLRQEPLHKVISEHYSSFNYWIYTGSEGTIDLYKRQHNSKKHIQQIKLPLNDLWKKEPGKSSSRLSRDIKTLYPILFPAPSNPKKILVAPDGAVFILTRERSLIHSLDKGAKVRKGWEMVYEDLPFSNAEAEIGSTLTGEYILLLFNVANRELMLLNITTGEKKTAFFNEWKSSYYNHFFFYGGCFHYIYGGYKPERWTIEWGEKILINSIENLPTELIKRYKMEEEEARKGSEINTGRLPILKNITHVFINQVNNLVFNNHELRLVNENVIKIQKTQFLNTQRSATVIRRNNFKFPDGSTIYINRSGMIILNSSDLSIGTIYIPAVLDVSLGAATRSHFAGNPYFQQPDSNEIQSIGTGSFWQSYIERFIKKIKSHAAENKTVS
jgi:hypothetical protein